MRRELSGKVPYLDSIRGPSTTDAVLGPDRVLRVGTYNVHRWTGPRGGRRWSPELAFEVIREMDCDVMALQEVLRPFDGEDPLLRLAEALHLDVAFVVTRLHKRGELGNAILSRWPMSSIFTINLSFGRLEQRSAVAAQFEGVSRQVAIVATHLALVDRTRRHQVRFLLDHPLLQGTTVLLGDMNAWRRCHATQELDREFMTLHHNQDWPASFPATRPLLALDRVYVRDGHVASLGAHTSAAARRGSDHLPIVATIRLNGDGADHNGHR